jgi:hypothetical protein
MKLQTTLIVVFGLTASAQIANAAQPDFQVNINLGAGNPARLFTSVGVAAPIGTDIWFVADKNGDGLNISGFTVNEDFFDSWTLGSSENVIFRVDTVDGQLINNTPGTFSRNNINVDSSADGLNLAFSDGRVSSPNANNEPTRVFGILWNNSTTDNPDGVNVGDQFAIFELALPEPNIAAAGNSIWSYTGVNVVANQFSVVAVPEPSTYALLALGGLGAFAFRRFRRA